MKNFNPETDKFSDVKSNEYSLWQLPVAYFAGGYAPLDLALFYPGGFVP